MYQRRTKPCQRTPSSCAPKGSRTKLRRTSLAHRAREAADLHYFMRGGTPRILAEYYREASGEHLGCSPEELKRARIRPWPVWARGGVRQRMNTQSGPIQSARDFR